MSLQDEDIRELTRRWANFNGDAADFLLLVARIARDADDLVDEDLDEPAKTMAGLLRMTMRDLPENPFYREHEAQLGTAIELAIFAWFKSEQWRRSDHPKTQMFAFVYRELVEQVVYVVARITGGWDHASRVADELHRLSHIEGNPETFEDWQRELA